MRQPVNDIFISGFRFSPPTHPGTDFNSRTDDKNLIAIKSGTVQRAFYDANGGNIVDIQFDWIDGRTFVGRYGHCSEILVKPGQKISEGQTVAIMGHTGTAYGDHCHFQIDMGWGWVDPEAWIENIRLVDYTRELEALVKNREAKLDLAYKQLYETMLDETPSNDATDNFRKGGWNFSPDYERIKKILTS